MEPGTSESGTAVRKFDEVGGSEKKGGTRKANSSGKKKVQSDL